MTEQAYNSIEPFSDDAIRTLYDLIVASGGTGELNDFRFFERCCYQAILRGAQLKFEKIDKNLAQQVFQEAYSSSAPTLPQDRVSLFVRSARTSILASSQLSRNEAILDGLQRGLELMGDQFSSIPFAKTIYGEKIEPDIHLSALQLEVVHKPTGKKIVAAWILGTRDGGMVFQEDLRKIDVVIPRVTTKLGKFPNLTIFSYVSDMTLDHGNIVSPDEVVPIGVDTARDLIGLGLKEATEEDKVELRKAFDSEIASTVRKIFTDRVRDLTRQPTEPVFRLVKTLNVAHNAGLQLTRESLKEEEKKLFGGSSKVLDRHLSDLIELGFAVEEGSELVPRIPRALDHLVTFLEEIQIEFGSNADLVLSVASKLGLAVVDRETDQARRKTAQEFDNALGGISVVKELTSMADVSKTFAADRARLMIGALDKGQSEGDLASNIVRTAALEILPDIQTKLAQTQLSSPGPIETSVTLTRQPVTPTPSADQSRPPSKDSSSTEQLVSLVLNDSGPITLEELVGLVAERGGTGELRSGILGMVMKNRLKLSA
jgi:hypothetical protein